MSGNTESTSNSIKFAPMPMSALLANLMPLQQKADTPDISFSTDDSDDSFSETVAKKDPSSVKVNKVSTPILKVPKDLNFASEKKSQNDHNKENCDDNRNRDTLHTQQQESAHKNQKTGLPTSEVKKRNALTLHNGNARNQNIKPPSAHKKTPEISKMPSSTQKTKTATPKIKTGIRKFTPGSARLSHKKTPQPTVIQNRDKVRCELFRHNQNECPPHSEPTPVEPPAAPAAPAALAAPVPNTPMNRKPIPASYAATPSYPQGLIGNNPNNKILFKTTSIKDKKYMFIKKLGTGGSSEVYKVSGLFYNFVLF